MAEYKDVIYEWHNEPGIHYGATVSIDQEWNSLDEDDDVFFYFATPEEFESAQENDNDYEFWILGENS